MDSMVPSVAPTLSDGLACHQTGDFAGAETIYRELLLKDSENKQVVFFLGTCLLQQPSRQEEGARYLETLLDDVPPQASVFINLGLYHFESRRYQQAEALFRKALQIDPDNAELHNKLACACLLLKHLISAAYHFEQTLLRNPAILSAYPALVGLLRQNGRFIDASIWTSRWLKAEPNCAMARAEHGVAFARAKFASVTEKILLSLPEEDADLLFYKAYLHQYALRPEVAIQYYRRAIEMGSDLANAHFNISLLLFAKGDFKHAWEEFDHRFSEGGVLPHHGHFEPEWDGSGLNGAGILVHSEQGIGDVIQFMRFFPLIQQRGGRVIFSSYPDVLQLMQSTEGAEVVEQIENLDLSYETQIPLLSLGKVFVRDESDIPGTVPYLFAESVKSDYWKRQFSTINGLKVGLVWAGNPDHTNDHNRSASLTDFAPLSKIGGVSYFALQKGPTAKQAVCPPEGMHLIALSDEIKDFTDTAAIISQLDLVICVDTSVAHLAGAMGKDVWLLIPDFCDWRWLDGREDSPWYPSMRVFKRLPNELWSDLLQRVADRLSQRRRELQPELGPAFQAECQALEALKVNDWSSAQDQFTLAVQQGGCAERIASEIAHGFVGRQYEGVWPIATSALYYKTYLASGISSIEDQIAYWQSAYSETADPRAGLSLVRLLKDQARYKEAILICNEVLVRDTENWLTRYELGQCFRLSGNDSAAVQEYQQVLGVMPRHPEAGINQAMTLERLGRVSDALRQIQLTAMCNPYHPKVRLFLAILLYRLRHYDLAHVVIEEHCLRYPADTLGQFWRGAIFRQIGRSAEALEMLMLLPADYAEPFTLAREIAYSRLELEWEQGRSIYERLLKVTPDEFIATINYEYGLYLISARQSREGWRLCEARRAIEKSDTFEQQFGLSIPAWAGDPLEGRRLLVFCEQGFGDTLQFLRFLDAIEGTCILIFQDGLDELLLQYYTRPNTIFVSRNTYRESPVAADCYVNLLSFPFLLGLTTDVDSIKAPYLKRNTTENQFAQLFAPETRPKVGLVWAGNPKHSGDRWRSIPLLQLTPVFELKDFAWYSLQKEAASNDALLLPPSIGMLNAASLSNNFYETALVIENMDLIIAVDTAVAHLAAAMGKKVWLLIPQQADWRWGRSGDSTEWYTNMTIFRQSVQGNWSDVVQSVKEALVNDFFR